MEHDAHVFFAVFEFGQDASVVTKLAGFEPTESWVVGQPMRKRPDVAHRHSRWTFKSPLPLIAPVEEHLDALVSALETHATGIRAVLSRFPAEIGCAVYFRTFTPGIHLPQQLLARVAALGLDIDFDLYFLGEDDEPDDHAVQRAGRANR
jgi:hypothetical protein